MTTNPLRITVAGSLFLCALAFGASFALAQQGEGIEVKPALIEETVDAGRTYTYSIKVRNVSSEAKTFYLAAQDIKGTDDEGRPVFSEGGERTPFDMSSWISFSRQSVDIKRGETVTIPFTVKIPGDASPGSHFASVFVSNEAPKVEKTGAAVGFRVGNIISLRISGETTEEMRLRELSTERFVYDAPPVTFKVKTENLGNVLLRPHGLVEVTDMWGKQVGTIEVNETAAAVFPGLEREYAVVWEYDKLALGRYQALAAINYGDQVKKTVTAAASFWVLPLKPIGLILGSLLAFVLVFYGVLRMYVKKKLREMGVDGKKGEASLYEKKYRRSSGRLVFVTISVFIVSMAFLVLLFVLFA